VFGLSRGCLAIHDCCLCGRSRGGEDPDEEECGCNGESDRGR
jgi:hypothetical protein